VRKAAPELVLAEIKAEQKPEENFETVLFLPKGEGRQGEGGLRTKGYFKKSETNKPLITVVTVVFNGEEHLEETILSVINQTYSNVEYIIVDGGSTDGTIDIIRKNEDFIDYWVSEKDAGIYDAMNKGIDLATGIWINFMNCGDLLLRIPINDMKYSLNLVYGEVVTNKGKKISISKNVKYSDFKKGMVVCHQACFYKNKKAKEIKYDKNYKLAADQKFTAQFFKLGGTFFCNKVLASYDLNGISTRNHFKILKEKLRLNKENSFSLLWPLISYLVTKGLIIRDGIKN